MNSCRALNHKTLWIEISKVIAGFLFSAAIISCTAAGNISSEASTVGSGSGSSGDLLKSLKQVKIIQEASTTEVETISMLVNTSKALRAALFTMEGVFIQEVEVIWTLTNPLFRRDQSKNDFIYSDNHWHNPDSSNLCWHRLFGDKNFRCDGCHHSRF